MVLTYLIVGISIVLVFIAVFRVYLTRKRLGLTLTTYCINLPDLVERRDHILSKFDPFKLDIQFVDAVDTRDDKWRAYKKYLTDDGMRQLENTVKQGKREKHSDLTPGAVGCFLSHVKCWKKFMDTNPGHSDILLILEDDSYPDTKLFASEMRLLFKNFPRDTDVILLSYITNSAHTEHKFHDFTLFKLNQEGYFFLMDAYLITKRGIEKIFKQLEARNWRIDVQIDSYLSQLISQKKLNIYYPVRPICYQDIGLFYTTIQTIPV